jgi:uncharacterized protein (TIGR02186 family)
MRVLLAILMLCAGALGAEAKPLIADMSGYRIEIDSGFSGTRLLLFGARNETGDVLVVVRGPAKDYMIRKKELVGGLLWLNRKKQKLTDVPSFYVIASSKPFKDIHYTDLLKPLGIGMLNIPMSDRSEFNNAFIDYQFSNAHYSTLEKVSFMDESLFKLVLPFPDNIPRGNYSVDIYLINDGHLTSMQSIPLQVDRIGFDAVVYEVAHQNGLFYGLFSVIMALVIGWGASRIIHKW